MKFLFRGSDASVNFARIVPDGLLVFFPSYYLLDQCFGCWKNKTCFFHLVFGINVAAAELCVETWI